MINLVDVEDSIINESKRKFFNDYIRALGFMSQCLDVWFKGPLVEHFNTTIKHKHGRPRGPGGGASGKGRSPPPDFRSIM